MICHARETVQKWLHAEFSDEIVFTKGCTESINLVASCAFHTLSLIHIYIHFAVKIYLIQAFLYLVQVRLPYCTVCRNSHL